MDERGKKPSIWTDILIILVLTKFLLELVSKQYLSSPSFVAFVLLALAAFLGLRSNLIHSVLRTGLSITAVAVFLMHIFYSEGPRSFSLLLPLLILLFAIYLLVRIFPGFK